jgi:hypothetical protein
LAYLPRFAASFNENACPPNFRIMFAPQQEAKRPQRPEVPRVIEENLELWEPTGVDNPKGIV